MEHLTVQILGRDYRLSCEPAERENLLAAVAHVDSSMQTIRDNGKIIGTERIAVFAALNIASALLARTGQTSATNTAATTQDTAVADPEILRRMQAIDALLDTALGHQERLF